METNNVTLEGRLKSWLAHRKSMKDLFRLNYSEEYVKESLKMVFKDEIVNRSQKFADTCDLDEQLTQIARCLTGTSGEIWYDILRRCWKRQEYDDESHTDSTELHAHPLLQHCIWLKNQGCKIHQRDEPA